MRLLRKILISGPNTHLRRTVITGLLLLIPLVLTYLVLRFLFDNLDELLQPVFIYFFERRIPGAGIAALAVLVYLVGLLGQNFAGRKLVQLTQYVLMRIPVVSTVYNATRRLIESFSGPGTTGLKRVVMIEYPRLGMWTVGFLTGVMTDETGKQLALVYVPTAPTPYTGWMAMVPVDQVYDTDLSVSTAFNMVLSGGVVSPATVKKRPMGNIEVLHPPCR
ncbi:MAG: DUF502 domain-containing protein [SAR202 cluster bacterium]|nr:DUF502 domain-containing protein [SAR202 cluster bacterium]